MSKTIEHAKEIIALEKHFDLVVPCEADHVGPGKATCSVKVTHVYRIRCVNQSLLVCENVAIHVASARAASITACSRCHRDAALCITVAPV